MTIYEFTQSEVRQLAATTFDRCQILERDLQRLFREKIDVISPDTLIIAEEFREWDGSSLRIDLLGVDRQARLVVIELKRTEDGGHMELQAIRYAAMVSTMTFDHAVETFDNHLKKAGREEANAREALLDFLSWDQPKDDLFAQETRIILVSGEFSREITTAVLWLNERELDIRCVRLTPHDMDGRLLVDVQQIIPLPEAAAYQVRARVKERTEREARGRNADYTRFNLTLGNARYVGEPKRRVVYLTFRYLVDDGEDPEVVAGYCGRRAGRCLYSVAGEVDADEFVRLAREASAAGGRAFDPNRFYCADDELARRNGRTYAFSNQWGGPDWEEAMRLITAAYDDRGIAYAPAE